MNSDGGLIVPHLDNRPEMRCSHIKSKIKALELLDPAVRKRVLDRFSKNTFDIVQNTKDDEWVPVEFMVDFVDCLAAEVGEQGVYELNVRAFRYSVDASIWGTYVRTALNLFKIKTTAPVQLFPSIWKRMYQNCGDIYFTKIDKNQHTVVIRNLPPMILNCRAYLLANAAGIVGLYSLGNIKAQVVLEQADNFKDVLYRVSWTPEEEK